VLVVLDASDESPNLVRRAWRSAEGLQAPLIAAWVETPSWARSSPEQRAALEDNIRFAEDIGAEIVRLRNGDAASAILQLVRDRNIESIFVRRPRVPRWRRLLGLQPLADQLLQRESGTRVGVHVAPAADDS
jgi:two-component system sensor histidine kinase KdpD